jgi:CHAT domain-containing protein
VHGGEKGDAEPLSGSARAFFDASARALLVSHWYVDSQTAVKITTDMFSELKRDPAIGRAEALRRAMLAAISAPFQY